MPTEAEIEAWLAERPECVQKLAKEFPFGTVFEDPTGARSYLMGYTEDDELIVSNKNPFEDYIGAMKDRHLVQAEEVRKALVEIQ